jgi:hypothetical protein
MITQARGFTRGGVDSHSLNTVFIIRSIIYFIKNSTFWTAPSNEPFLSPATSTRALLARSLHALGRGQKLASRALSEILDVRGMLKMEHKERIQCKL